MKFRIFSVGLLCVLAVSRALAGPFGLDKGMTKEQVQKLIGNVPMTAQSAPGVFEVDTVPNPSSHFDSYYLVFAPSGGLIKIVAGGKIVQTSMDGAAVRDEFDAIRAALVEKYGPAEDYSFLRAGSIWTKPQDYMEGIVKLDRQVMIAWKLQNRPDQLQDVSDDLDAISSSKGFVKVTYEFEGWTEVSKQLKAQQNSSL